MSQANTVNAKAFQDHLDLLNRDFTHQQRNESLLPTFGSSSIHSLRSSKSAEFAIGRAMSPSPFHSMFAKDVGAQFIEEIGYDVLEKSTHLVASVPVHGDSQTSILDPSDNSILCHRQVLHALDSLDFINHQNNVSGPTVSGLLPKGASVINGQTKEFDIEDQVQQLENGKVLEHETVLTGKMRWVVLPLVLLLVIMWRLFYTV